MKGRKGEGRERKEGEGREVRRNRGGRSGGRRYGYTQTRTGNFVCQREREREREREET